MELLRQLIQEHPGTFLSDEGPNELLWMELEHRPDDAIFVSNRAVKLLADMSQEDFNHVENDDGFANLLDAPLEYEGRSFNACTFHVPDSNIHAPTFSLKHRPVTIRDAMVCYRNALDKYAEFAEKWLGVSDPRWDFENEKTVWFNFKEATSDTPTLHVTVPIAAYVQ